MRRPTCLILLLTGLTGMTGCGQADDGYLPLDSERTLTYAVTQTRSGEAQQHKQLSRINGPIELAGQSVYREFTASGPQRLLQRRAAGIFEVGYSRPDGTAMHDQPTLVLPQPLTTDSRWQAPVTTELLEWRKHSLEKSGRRYHKSLPASFHCESLDDRVRTPAGTFSNVARVRAVARRTIEYASLQEQSVIHVELTRWYAPGVGLIKSERHEYAESRELNPGTATLQLERID